MKVQQQISCTEIECLVAKHWDYRKNIIVPNVSWGLGLHECDLLIVSQSNYATEIEIKVSKSDLKKDATKKHAHKSNRIKYLYFAVPEKLETCIDLIPEHAGIIIIKHYNDESIFGTTNRSYNYVSIIREPKANPEAKKLTDAEVLKLGRLASMRIWTLKPTVVGLMKDNRYMRERLNQNERVNLLS